MFKDSIRNDEQVKKITRIVIVLAVLVFIFFSILIFQPQMLSVLPYRITRINNLFSYYVLQAKPNFYYLEMEKNGNDIRVNANESFDVTYRDEFAVKSVVSDDLTGKYITVKVEFLGKGGNDIGILLRGVDLVNKIMQSDEFSRSTGSISGYKIHINYKSKPIASIPMKVVITPVSYTHLTLPTKRIV